MKLAIALTACGLALGAGIRTIESSYFNPRDRLESVRPGDSTPSTPQAVELTRADLPQAVRATADAADAVDGDRVEATLKPLQGDSIRRHATPVADSDGVEEPDLSHPPQSPMPWEEGEGALLRTGSGRRGVLHGSEIFVGATFFASKSKSPERVAARRQRSIERFHARREVDRLLGDPPWRLDEFQLFGCPGEPAFTVPGRDFTVEMAATDTVAFYEEVAEKELSVDSRAEAESVVQAYLDKKSKLQAEIWKRMLALAGGSQPTTDIQAYSFREDQLYVIRRGENQELDRLLSRMASIDDGSQHEANRLCGGEGR